jgi:hypothetical protein
MSKRAKHRWTKEESELVWVSLTPDEQKEYNDLALGYGLSGATANLVGMRRIENIAYTRIEKGSE